MKLRKILLGVLFLIISAFCVGCTSNQTHAGKTKVVFELEGGTYQNCVRPIVHYYDFKDGTQNLIVEPTSFSGAQIEKANYHIEGWYKTKTENDGEVVYSDKWDFETDKVDNTGVTLYAYWKKNTTYSYEVCYRNTDGSETVLGSYEVSAGDTFDDYLNYAKKRYGYTAIGFKTATGEDWAQSYTHPGGEESLAVQVFVEYIEGNYSLVRTLDDLKKNKKNNIYLLADIDLQGEAFSFDNYNKTFIGNGHTISNFKINYDARTLTEVDGENNCLCISLFGNTKGAVIKDVNFENVQVNVITGSTKTKKIYVTPLATSMTETTVENVAFTGTFGYTELPTNFLVEDLIIVTDAAYYKKDNDSTIVNCTINVENVGKITEE